MAVHNTCPCLVPAIHIRVLLFSMSSIVYLTHKTPSCTDLRLISSTGAEKKSVITRLHCYQHVLQSQDVAKSYVSHFCAKTWTVSLNQSISRCC